MSAVAELKRKTGQLSQVPPEEKGEFIVVLQEILVVLKGIRQDLPILRYTYDEVRRAMISKDYWRDSLQREVPVDVGAYEKGTVTFKVTPGWVWLPNKLQIKFAYDRSFNLTGYTDVRRPELPDLKLEKAARPIDFDIGCHKPFRKQYILDYEEVGGFADNWLNTFLYTCMVEADVYKALEEVGYDPIIEWLRRVAAK